MTLADLLQRKINRKQEKRLTTYEKVPSIVDTLREAAKEKTTNSDATSAKTPLCISLDMLIAFREEFPGGWNVWLGDDEVTKLTPELKQEQPTMTFDEKASTFFRLSVWSKKTPDPNARDITDIPDGTEVFVERVTGLSLFENKLAQGNTTRVEVVIKGDEPDSEVESSAAKAPGDGSQSTEGNQTDHELPLTTKRSKRKKACRGAQTSGEGEEQPLANNSEPSQKLAGVADEAEERFRSKKSGSSKQARTE